MNKDKKAFIAITLIREVVTIYFDTFFAIYFFNIVNYQIFPLAKYYLTVYITIIVSFWLIRNFMKSNNKIPFYRIGISLTALYLSLIMLLKDNIINYIIPVAIIKGLGEGFYFFPTNILNSEKITNEERVKYDGLVNSFSKTISIIIPLLLGILLTYYSYIQIGKFIFALMIIIFALSYFVKDNKYAYHCVEIKKFMKVIKKNHKLKEVLVLQFLKGFTISSGVLCTVIVIYKIINFETNLNIGILDSVISVISLLSCILYAVKIKANHYQKIIIVTGILMLLSMGYLAFSSTKLALIIYLVIRWTLLTFCVIMSGTIINNIANHEFILKNNYKTEYYLILETVLAIARVSGYLILLMIGITNRMQYLSILLIICAIMIFLFCYYLLRVLKE